GQKGGEATSENHDKEFYQEIGQKGGEATSENHDKEFYQEIGEKGGEARANQRDGSDDGKMSREEAGRKGGQKSRR
ncbi:KGG domain-containing protein, partial [Peribacillus sp. NPDC058002]